MDQAEAEAGLVMQRTDPSSGNRSGVCVGRRNRDLATERSEVPGLALDDPRLCRGQYGGGSGRPPGGLKQLARGKSGLSGCPRLSPHCRSSSLCPEAGTPPSAQGPLVAGSNPPRHPPTTLISLLPFLLFGVDVLLRCRLDLLDPGRPGGGAESAIGQTSHTSHSSTRSPRALCSLTLALRSSQS